MQEKFTAEEIAFLSTAFHGTASPTFTQAITYSGVTPETNIFIEMFQMIFFLSYHKD